MNLVWDFYNPTHIRFGLQFPEGLKHVAAVDTLLVTSPGSSKRGITGKIENDFRTRGISFRTLDIATANPSFVDLASVVNKLNTFKPQQILAVGGGSPLDLGKILSYVLSSTMSVPELCEQLRSGKALPTVNPIPFIACPTTAGTGSEVTPFATLWDMEHRKKYSVVANNLFPGQALLFPELTVTLPWEVTVSTGLDALSQCLESIWNRNHTPLTGAIAEKGVATILKYLPVLKKDPTNLEARSKLQEASLFSGICISKTRTAMAHAMSYPLTAHYGTPHGIACSFTLPDLWQYNLPVDDGRMLSLANALGVPAENFHKVLLEFMQQLDFQAEFKKTISDLEAVTKLTSEMHTPGRADNNLRAFEKAGFEDFVRRSTQRWI